MISGPRYVAAGLIIVEYGRVNLCHLFATERDRMRWHLRRELLTPGIPAERVAEIRAEIALLDLARSATWGGPHECWQARARPLRAEGLLAQWRD